MLERMQLLSVSDAARLLGVTEETVRRHVRSGKLLAEKLGQQWFVHVRDLESFSQHYDPRLGPPRKKVKMNSRKRNSPTVRETIRQFLLAKNEPANIEEIYEFVVDRVRFTSKTPRGSMNSVLTWMPEVVRVERGVYTLTAQSKASGD